MQLHFLGANRQVTGSRYLLEIAGKRVLIDCGMFQERDYLYRNWAPSPIPAEECDALLLTHAHLDHCGLIPRLVREGYGGPIYCTEPTLPLTEIILKDAAKIQSEDAAYKRKRHAREGRKGPHQEEPLYDEGDVERTMRLFRSVPYRQPAVITDELTVTFHDAGHIFGSAMLDCEVRGSEGRSMRILFSGDIGQWNKPIIHDPTLFNEADHVIMESTYGDRNHEIAGDVETQLAEVIQETVKQDGNIVIPTFAIERAQELMFHLGRLIRSSRIPSLPVYVDSPMSVDATEVYYRFPQFFDAETTQLIRTNMSPLKFPGLRMARTVEESKAINRAKGSSVIMATSGMCTAGRIKHHLRQNITDPNSTILFVGYQSHGTLGRQILDGAREVRIHGHIFPVRAKVTQIYGFSGHADRAGLIKWLTHLRRAPSQVYLTHGEEKAATSLASYIRDEMHWPVAIPDYGSVVDLN
jgi:metallo-beta-lactamase family protein